MQRIGLENSLLSSSKRRDTCYHQMNSNPKLLHQRSQWDTPQLQDSIFLFKNRNPYHNTPPPSTVLTPKKPNSKYHLSHKAGMSTITPEDEALIQKFVGLQTEENKPLKIAVPTTAASNTNWERCILAKVISNKSMLDAPFSAAMLQAWGADPETIFRSVGKNSYLIEFQNKEDMYMAELNGPWTFRGDLVATCMVNCHQDLQSVRMEHANLWVQFHHVPINSLTEEGFDILGRQIGIPVSTHVEGFINGRRLYKLKIRVPITKPLKDKVWLDHPTLGDLKILCVYEKVSRICRFCGHLGHEIQTCPEHQHLFLLLQNPALCTNMQPSQIMAPKFGLWIANPMRVPKPEEEGKPKDQSPPNPGPKRAYRDRPKQGLDLGEEGGSNEKWGGNSALSTQNRAFRVWVNGAGLIDLGHQGPAYTWCNNQQGRDMICQRLDRALSNLAWSLQYPETTVFHIPRFQSDHHPILIRTKLTPLLSRRKFRSENWWLSAEGFDGVYDIVGQGAERGWKETVTPRGHGS